MSLKWSPFQNKIIFTSFRFAIQIDIPTSLFILCIDTNDTYLNRPTCHVITKRYCNDYNKESRTYSTAKENEVET